ncbi:hypothetical protein [Roseateles sp. BYS87W]|uniref:DUF4189 domain-containing protein n=1 Tax=Pelomonas baiyunensis TaxID=3299026 RepID=A0ABW7H1M6_9BURK
MKLRPWITGITLPALCVALHACAHPPVTPAPAPPAAAASEPESLRLTRELRALVEPAACTADAQCATLPVGAKACGGPAGYWAWAPQSAHAERVRATAQRLAEAQRQENDARGLRSNCAVTPDPGAVCTAGRCQLRSAADAAR